MYPRFVKVFTHGAGARPPRELTRDLGFLLMFSERLAESVYVTNQHIGGVGPTPSDRNDDLAKFRQFHETARPRRLRRYARCTPGTRAHAL